MQKIRNNYLEASKQLESDIKRMTSEGFSKEDIAKHVVNARNQQKVTSRANMTIDERAGLEARNIEIYGNPIGPNSQWLFNITSEGYSIIDANSINGIENGEGGFSEEGELLGIYVDDYKLYFQYNDKKYESKPEEIICSNEMLNDGNRNFQIKIKDVLVCNIIYKPYIIPFVLTFGDDEDEFDFLLYLSNLMVDKNAILNFINGMNNLKQYYSNI